MCTNFKVLARDIKKTNGTIVGRSMENAVFMGAKLFFRAEGHEYTQCFYDPTLGENTELTSSKKFGFHWKGKYGLVGMSAFDQPMVSDGINTKGLYVGMLQLNETKYQEITDPSKGITFSNVPVWLLSSFETCEEIKRNLERGMVQIGNSWSQHFGQHFAIHDRTGKSIVVEILEGKINIHDNNDVGVLTNDPSFPWQMTNLKNYISISPYKTGKAVGGNFAIPIQNESQGSGFTGIPGGQLPSSRFVRSAMMVNYSWPVSDLNGAVNLTYHILNTIDIPFGVVRENESIANNNIDRTLWATVSDLERLVYRVRMYDSPQVYAVNLKELIPQLGVLNGKHIEVPVNQLSIDLTKEIQNEVELEFA